MYHNLRADTIHVHKDYFYSEATLRLFENDFQNGKEDVKERIRRNQKVLMAPSYGLTQDERTQAYLTNGMDLNEVILDFLSRHSTNFKNFKLLNLPSLEISP